MAEVRRIAELDETGKLKAEQVPDDVGAVVSVDGRVGAVTLDDLYEAAGTSAAAVAALVNGATAAGNTLSELEARLAVVEALGSLATDAELVAAVTALIGTADTAGDTLGELQALIGARALDSAVVKLTGDQSIDGVKTFTSAPKIPDAAAADEPASKGQLDALSGASVARLGGTSPTTAPLPYLNVKDYGAAGDGVTDDTAAIQAAFDAAKAIKCDVFFPAPAAGQFYKLTSAVTISRRGQTIRGENPWYCIIQQTTAGAHAFTIADDTDAGGTIATGNQHVIFENLRIFGAGIGTATGYGINAPGDGDWMVLRNVTIYGFAIGVFLDGWAQCLFDTCVFGYNGIGVHTAKVDSAANTIHWLNSGCARNDTIGWYHEGGGGWVVSGGDWVAQPLHMKLGTGTGTGSTGVINGCNFEAVMGAGTAFIEANSGTRLAMHGTQFQKGTSYVGSVDADGVLANSGSSVFYAGCTLTGAAATKVLVRKAVSTVIVSGITSSTNLGVASLAVADPSTSYSHAQFPQRADNAVPVAADVYRGLMLQGMGRDATSVADTLSWYGRDRRSGSDVFLRYEISGRLPAVSATWDPASIASGAMVQTTVTVTGAILGDLAVASFSVALPAGVAITAAVTATDTVTVSLINLSGGAVDLASGTVRATVIKR